MKKINSEILGELLQDKMFPDWWKSVLIEIPLFSNIKLEVIFMDFQPEEDVSFIKEADSALRNFFSLNEEYRKGISDLVYKNYLGAIDAVGRENVTSDMPDILNIEDVWEFVHPSEIYLSRRPCSEPNYDNDIYIEVACECDWEEEHGLQLVFKQGKKITRVSAQDGHLTDADAWGKLDEEDELLSKF